MKENNTFAYYHVHFIVMNGRMAECHWALFRWTGEPNGVTEDAGDTGKHALIRAESREVWKSLHS